MKRIIFTVFACLFFLSLISCGKKLSDNGDELNQPTETAETTEPAQTAEPDEIIVEDIDIIEFIPIGEFSKYRPVVYNRFLLGGSDETGWLNPFEIAKYLQNGDKYSVYSKEGFVCYAAGSGVAPEGSWVGPYAEYVELSGISYRGEIISIGGDWDAIPRKTAEHPLDDEKYINIIYDLLVGYGLEEPVVDIRKNFHIDMDGDGTDEVAIYAECSDGDTYNEKFFSLTEGYSLLILIKNVGGEDKIFVLGYDIHTEPPNIRVRNFFDIFGFYDLNGDGKLELVTTWRYYEGSGCNVWEITDDNVLYAMGNGLGV